VWQETCGYEPNTAHLSSIATSITEGATTTLNSSINYDAFGRTDTHGYPSDLNVRNLYAPYGQSAGLANASTGQVYWMVDSQDAWGHVTGEHFLDGTVGTHSYYPESGLASQLSWNGLDSMTYSYDSFGNLTSQSRSAASVNNGESFNYDALQRLLLATRGIGAPIALSYATDGISIFCGCEPRGLGGASCMLWCWRWNHKANKSARLEGHIDRHGAHSLWSRGGRAKRERHKNLVSVSLVRITN